MSINIERVKSNHRALAEIGSLPGGGVSRLALTKEDIAGRNLFKSWLENCNIDCKLDDLGNVYGVRQGTDPNRKPVVVGSHLDSVPSGGNFDGVLGVLAGVEIMARLEEEGIRHRNPFIVADFTNEEGARFPISMISSGVLSGKYTKDEMYNIRDKNGILLGDELEKFDQIGDESNRLKNVEAFAELHIEQGPILENEGKTIGIVQGIQGFSWYELKVKGEADHAGPTPMGMRKDALIAATNVIQSLHEWVTKLEDDTTITFGSLSVAPDAVNVIAGDVTVTIDIRNPDKEILLQREKEMKNQIEDLLNNNPIQSWDLNLLTHKPPVQFHKPFLEQVENICKTRNYSYRDIISGAGHDSMYMNEMAPTFMLFVPSIGGKSHHPTEKTSWSDIEAGINVLYDWVKQQIDIE